MPKHQETEGGQEREIGVLTPTETRSIFAAALRDATRGASGAVWILASLVSERSVDELATCPNSA